MNKYYIEDLVRHHGSPSSWLEWRVPYDESIVGNLFAMKPQVISSQGVFKQAMFHLAIADRFNFREIERSWIAFQVQFYDNYHRETITTCNLHYYPINCEKGFNLQGIRKLIDMIIRKHRNDQFIPDNIFDDSVDHGGITDKLKQFAFEMREL